ncbi:unnamed protein product [Rangifer tarandus platyrhynchus]|uniref:Uncharacterized protein n=2 Tax=Rangifer tarandus platyrhynchus TaxID=3082113 RepID=A0ABN8XPK5_RANTA|nr:unnamed protein product [Rangifer tarandus platyrhynchus]CAI9691574.1 unnamed protein product [Rangifer tarandus platyrhynchus]
MESPISDAIMSPRRTWAGASETLSGSGLPPGPYLCWSEEPGTTAQAPAEEEEDELYRQSLEILSQYLREQGTGAKDAKRLGDGSTVDVDSNSHELQSRARLLRISGAYRCDLNLLTPALVRLHGARGRRAARPLTRARRPSVLPLTLGVFRGCPGVRTRHVCFPSTSRVKTPFATQRGPRKGRAFFPSGVGLISRRLGSAPPPAAISTRSGKPPSTSQDRPWKAGAAGRWKPGLGGRRQGPAEVSDSARRSQPRVSIHQFRYLRVGPAALSSDQPQSTWLCAARLIRIPSLCLAARRRSAADDSHGWVEREKPRGAGEKWERMHLIPARECWGKEFSKGRVLTDIFFSNVHFEITHLACTELTAYL